MPDQPKNPRGGPRTPEGKMRSSINGLKHGLTAESPQAMQAMAEACDADMDQILADLRWHYQPMDPVDEALVRRIAGCLFKLEHTEAMQRRMFDRRPQSLRPSSTVERLAKYERLVDMQLHRAIRALTAKREAPKSKIG
jgi:hypothetical protein